MFWGHFKKPLVSGLLHLSVIQTEHFQKCYPFVLRLPPNMCVAAFFFLIRDVQLNPETK
jgi:predicted neuraminidase